MVTAALVAALLVQSGPPGTLPEVITRTRVDPSRGVDFHATIAPDTVYVGQQATYQLGVFLDQDTRQRIRRNPEFQPPETRSLLSYDLRDRGGPQSATIGGRPYETHVFRRAVFALTPGRYAIPPARLTYSLPQTSSFFSRDETFTLRSEPINLVVVEPPRAGRPPDWAGAVGSWRAVARLDTSRGRAGDPLVLTLRVEGQGNVTLLPRPRVDVSWASVVNADERVVLDSSPPLLGGWKEFDWLVTPTMPGARVVPPVRYVYFNPRTHRYEVATTAPIPLRVAAGDVAATEVTSPASPAALRPPPIVPALGEPSPRPVGRSVAAVFLVAVAPVVALAMVVLHRPKKARPAPTPAQRLQAAASIAGLEGVRAVRLALIDGVATRTGVDVTACMRPGSLAAALRRAGVTRQTADVVETLLAALDTACFGRGDGFAADWAARGQDALQRLDAEACDPPARARRPRHLAALAALGVVMFPGTLPAQSAADAFALGVTAYAGGDYVRASRYFADAAHAEPRSFGAWANLGTAAMMAHDTALAVVGWQRALRLAPLNSTIRRSLATVPAPQDSGPARVLPIPEWVAAGFALLVWVVGWAGVAWLAWRRRPVGRVALLTATVGGAALWFAMHVERKLEGRDLVVITSPAPLRALPALGAETRATPLLGEVADVLARDGVWVHVRLEGGREGWMPTERVARLDDN